MCYVNKRRAALLRNVTDARGFLPSLSVWTTLGLIHTVRFFSDCDSDASYCNNWVVQGKMEVFTLSNCDYITNFYRTHCKPEQIAVAIRKQSCGVNESLRLIYTWDLLLPAYVVRPEVMFSLCPPFRGGGVPGLRSGGGTPSQVWLRGVPSLRFGGVPHLRSGGYPISGPGYPPQTDHHSKLLLRGGQYASCVHAGGLSC